MPVISAMGELRQEDHMFKVSLSYITRLSKKKKKKKEKERKEKSHWLPNHFLPGQGLVTPNSFTGTVLGEKRTRQACPASAFHLI
jgi:hypothetical protein